MKGAKIILSSFCMVWCLCAYGASSENKIVLVPLSIEQVTQLGLRNSLDIQIAKLDAYRKRASLAAAESIFDTFFNAHIDYLNDETRPPNTIVGTKTTTNTYSFGMEKKIPTGTTVALNAGDVRTASNSPFASLNPYHEARASASFTQPLGKNFFGLADHAGIKITKIDIENSEFSSLDAIEHALYDIQVAYWNYVSTDEELRIRSGILTEAQRLYNAYRDKYGRGLAEEVDMFAVEANLRSRESEVVLARLRKETAKNNLLFLLNEDDLSIQIQALDSLATPSCTADLYDSLRKATAHRRDYKRARNQLQAVGIDIAVKKNALWPEIDLEASFLKNGLNANYWESWQDISGEDNSEVAVGVTLRFPLENRYAKAQLEEVHLKKEQLILSFQRLERSIVTEINNAVRQVNAVKEEVGLLEAVVRLQENKLKEETERFGYGRSDSDTIIRYAEDVLRARLSWILALRKYRVSLADLALAQNTLLDTYWEGSL